MAILVIDCLICNSPDFFRPPSVTVSYQPSSASNLQAIPAIPGETMSANTSDCRLSENLCLPYHFKLPI